MLICPLISALFSLLIQRPNAVPLPPIVPVTRSEPLSLDQWKRYLDPSGRVTCVENLRQIIFSGVSLFS